MSVEAETIGREGCSVHADRLAVERCARCGRAACLSCAIPVRGEVLCAECATRQEGKPAPAPEPRISGRLDLWTLACFGVGLLATIPPWDRFGAYTSPLSAWRADPDPRSLVAAIALGLGTLLAVAAIRRPALGFARWPLRLSVLLSTGAVVFCAAAILGAPEYVSHTPAPYAALAGSAAALTLSVIRLRRRRAA